MKNEKNLKKDVSKMTNSKGLFWPLFILNIIDFIFTNSGPTGPFDNLVEEELGKERFSWKSFIKQLCTAVLVTIILIIWFKYTNR